MQLIINEYVSKSSQNLVHYLSCQGCWTYCISWFLLRPYSYRPYRTWPRDGLGFKGPTLALRVEDLALRFWPWRHHWAIVVFSLRLVIHLQHINFRSTHFSTQTSCRRVADLASSWFQISSFLSPSCYSTPQQDRHPRGLSLTGSLGTSSTSRQLRPWIYGSYSIAITAEQVRERSRSICQSQSRLLLRFPCRCRRRRSFAWQ